MSLSHVEISGVESERPLLTPCSLEKGLLCPTLLTATSESLSQRRLPSDSDLLMNDLTRKEINIEILHKRNCRFGNWWVIANSSQG